MSPRASAGAKAQRTDLPGKVAIKTAPGQAYGKQTAQQQSQRIVPVAAPPVPGGGANTPPGQPPAAPGPPQPGPAAVDYPAPGSLPFLGPSDRPNEPITHGLPSGAGAGPEALTGFAQAGAQAGLQAEGTTKQLLQHLASQPAASSIVQQLAANA